ncbi:MAG: hypothetical protein WDM91_10540 [Rhizomicrobium sp.]
MIEVAIKKAMVYRKAVDRLAANPGIAEQAGPLPVPADDQDRFSEEAYAASIRAVVHEFDSLDAKDRKVALCLAIAPTPRSAAEWWSLSESQLDEVILQAKLARWRENRQLWTPEQAQWAAAPRRSLLRRMTQKLKAGRRVLSDRALPLRTWAALTAAFVYEEWTVVTQDAAAEASASS